MSVELEHPAEPMPYPDAICYVERWLTEHHLTYEERACGFSWHIYDWLIYDYYNRSTERALQDRPWVGVRVAEVSVSNPTGGGSYMQVDMPWGIAMCGQVERCILALIEGWNQYAWTSIEGGELCTYGADTDEEFWRLSHLIEELNK